MCPLVGIINPGEFAPANSIEVVIWAAVGGRGTLIGPIIGAITVNLGKSWFTAQFPEYWLFVLGGLFVAVTLFMPKGILGTLSSFSEKISAFTSGSKAEPKIGAAESAEMSKEGDAS